MKVLILGSSGLLGQALMREWSGDEVIGLSSNDVDIRDNSRVLQTVRNLKPEWIVLSAAYTDVDGCESNQERAFAVNRAASPTLTARIHRHTKPMILAIHKASTDEPKQKRKCACLNVCPSAASCERPGYSVWEANASPTQF